MNVTALILAGGQSKRFSGKEKYFLVLNNERFLDRQIRVLSGLSDEILLITRDANHCSRFTDFAQVHCIPDIRTNTGPAGGLHAGAIHAKNTVLITIACDMPCIKKEVFEYLLSLIKSYEAVIPVHDNGMYEMLHAVYNREALSRVLSDTGIGKLTEITGLLKTRSVSMDEIRQIDPHLTTFININRPEELERIQKRGDL
jgi:molybdenum cofactor guanylyltransferase